MYIVHQSIGNFSEVVFESEEFYEVQDFLMEQCEADLEEAKMADHEEILQLLLSYYHIEVKEDD